MELESEDGENEGRRHEHQERHPPVECVGEQTGCDRAHERTNGISRAVGTEHPAAAFDRVVVGEQGVVGGIDDRLADAATASGDGEHHHPAGQPGEATEHRPHERTGDGQGYTARAIGVLGDWYLQRQCPNRGQGDEPEHLGVVEVEVIADVGQQDTEGGAVQFVDGVQPEQHHQWVGRLSAAQAAQPLHRVRHVTGKATNDTLRHVASTLRPVSSLTIVSRNFTHRPPSPPGSTSSTSRTPKPVDRSCQASSLMNQRVPIR